MKKNWKQELIWAITLYAFVLLTIWALSSCSTSKVVSEDVTVSQHISDTQVHTSDSVLHTEAVKDSIEHMVSKTDSINEVKHITDSTIIENTVETVITNTVNASGELIGTDRVTNRTVSRDHYRIENNNKTKESNNTDNVTQKHYESTLDRQKREYDSLVAIIDSMSHNTFTEVEKDSRSWWQKVQDMAARFVFSILITLLVAALVWYGARYLTGR